MSPSWKTGGLRAYLAALAALTLAAPVAALGAQPGSGFVMPPAGASFVTLKVTTTADFFSPEDIVGRGTGRLSLREAFALANRLDTEATIVLHRGASYRLERCGALTGPPNAGNELVHLANKPLTVTGNAASVVQTCPGAGVIVQQGGDQLLNLVDIAIRGGRSTHSPAGGVWSSGRGEVRISNSVVADNQAAWTGPGAVSAGGVAVNGDLYLSAVTLADNRSDHGAGAAASAGSLKAVKSSVHDNRGPMAGAFLAGRGIAGPPPPGPPPATGMTPPGVTLVYSTLVDNQWPQVRVVGAGLTSFASAIVGSGEGPLCALDAPGRTLGANVAAQGADCGFGSGDAPSVKDARLVREPGMKGVDVYRPGAGSPLLDALPIDRCLPFPVRILFPVYSSGDSDELGVLRPQGGACDIGAVEAISGRLDRAVVAPPQSDLPVRNAATARAGALRLRATDTRDGFASTTLRDAFRRANLADRDAVIMLEPKRTYVLDRCVAPQLAVDNDTNELTQLSDHQLTIVGSASTIVQTCSGSAVIKTFGAGRLQLIGVTIAGGRSVEPGGGIYTAGGGDLRLENSWVTDNTSTAAGGGVAAFGNVELIGSTLSHNHSNEFGGALIGTGDVSAVNSSVFENTAGIAIGGLGVHSGRLTLRFSTVARNTAPNLAGGNLSAIGALVLDAIPNQLPLGMGPGSGPPGPGGPPPSGPLPAGPPPAASTAGPPPGGLPPPSNCWIETPPTAGSDNVADDPSCGFRTVAKLSLAPGPGSKTVLELDGPGPAPGVSAETCRHAPAQDQLGRVRRRDAACAPGAVGSAEASAARAAR